LVELSSAELSVKKLLEIGEVEALALAILLTARWE
jgi:hypothetical protein